MNPAPPSEWPSPILPLRSPKAGKRGQGAHLLFPAAPSTFRRRERLRSLNLFMPPEAFFSSSTKLVICDIDGCLGPEAQGTVHDAAALARLRRYNEEAQAGAPWPALTLCSGRPLPYVEALARVLGVRHPAVAENGVWLWTPTEPPARDPAIEPAILEGLAAFSQWVRSEIEPRNVQRQPGKECSLSLRPQDPATLDALVEELTAYCEHERLPVRISRTVEWINCDLRMVDKGTGVSRLRAHCGLEREQLAAIGDTPHDLAMRREVARFGAPANAHPDVKALADRVSAHQEVLGVFDLLAIIGD